MRDKEWRSGLWREGSGLGDFRFGLAGWVGCDSGSGIQQKKHI